MIQYLIRRLLLATFTLLTIMLVSYVLLRLAPGDPTRSNMFGSERSETAIDSSKGTATPNRAMREKLNLDKPILTGFVLWLKTAVLQGDLGTSVAVDPGRPVTKIILDRIPVTITLNSISIVLIYLIAVPLGVLTALHAGNWLDQISAIALFVLYSLPVTWLGLVLQALLCEGGYWGIFPLKGLEVTYADELSIWELQWEIIRHYTLPVLCLSYSGLAGLSRYARSGMLEVIHADYIRTARAKGLPEYNVIWVHAFRNAIITLITLLSGLLPSLVAGSILVEFIFNIPGMGSLSLLALSSRDYPLQMALFAFAGVLTLAGVLIADLLYLVADPRIKLTR